MSAFFRTVLDREELRSTSDLARELVLAGDAPLPLLVRARRQTAGRGRGANRWWSDGGSLTLTIALDPSAHGLRRDHEPRLALVAALGVIWAAESLLPPGTLCIRWPNDIEAAGKKLAGILPERVETSLGPRLLIGIGLNVNTRMDQAPDEVRALACSLETLGGPGPDPERVLRAILAEVPVAIARLADDDPDLAREWAARDALFGQAVRLELGAEVRDGRGAGIDATGGLRLEEVHGTKTYHAGQVLRGHS